MGLTEEILCSLPDGVVNTVIVGLNWTVVSVAINGQNYCGLSSTLRKSHQHGKDFDVPDAGKMTQYSSQELAAFCTSNLPTLTSIGCAALNAALQSEPMSFIAQNAEEIIVKYAPEKRVVVVGHFPFTERIRRMAGHLDVLENEPGPGDLPGSQAPETIPFADVVAITGMTFVNHTLEPLLSLCQPNTKIILLGASTPLSKVLFDYGIDFLCGAVTVSHDAVLRSVAQGAVYPQIVKAGLNLVTIQRS